MMAQANLNAPAFMRGLRGRLPVDEPMSPHTGRRVGGVAVNFYPPADKTDQVQRLAHPPAEMPIYCVGHGLKLLVRDGGVAGMVLRPSKGLSPLSAE